VDSTSVPPSLCPPPSPLSSALAGNREDQQQDSDGYDLEAADASVGVLPVDFHMAAGGMSGVLPGVVLDLSLLALGLADPSRFETALATPVAVCHVDSSEALGFGTPPSGRVADRPGATPMLVFALISAQAKAPAIDDRPPG
jgi:hypothetical protein